jgi:hypothetical protein
MRDLDPGRAAAAIAELEVSAPPGGPRDARPGPGRAAARSRQRQLGGDIGGCGRCWSPSSLLDLDALAALVAIEHVAVVAAFVSSARLGSPARAT